MRPLLFILISGALFAQSASVYDLDPSEMADGQKLYKAKLEADSAYDTWHHQMNQKYLNGQSGQFDSKFHHIIPETNSISSASGVLWGNGTVTTPYYPLH